MQYHVRFVAAAVVASHNLKFYTHIKVWLKCLTSVDLRNKKPPFLFRNLCSLVLLLCGYFWNVFFSFLFLLLIWANCDIAANSKTAKAIIRFEHLFIYYLRKIIPKWIKWLNILFIAIEVYARLSSALYDHSVYNTYIFVFVFRIVLSVFALHLFLLRCDRIFVFAQAPVSWNFSLTEKWRKKKIIISRN